MSDLRRALRTIHNSPAPSAVVILTLAVAIGGATTMYGVVDLFWHFLPAQASGRLVYVASTITSSPTSQSAAADVAWTPVSVPDLIDLTSRAQTVQQFAGFTFGTATLTGATAPERVATVRATPNLPAAWGMTPAFGRVFRGDEAALGANGVVLLTNAFWRRRFNSAPSVLGQPLLLDGAPHTIVGVLPNTIDHTLFAGTDVMLPMALDSGTARDERQILLSAVLRPGTSREQAQADLERIALQLQAEYPRTNARTGIVVRPLIEMLGRGTPMLLGLVAMLGILLIALACANVSNVMLSIATARQREFAVRIALGGRVTHLVRQLIAEGLVFAAAAAALGVLFAWAAIGGIQALEPAAASFGAISMSPRVVVAAVAMAATIALGLSLVPMLRTARLSAQAVTAGSSRTGEPRNAKLLRQLFVATQVALAVMLVAQVAAIARGAWAYRTLDYGFDERDLLTFKVELSPRRYSDDDALRRFIAESLTRVEALPGVSSAGIVNRLPVADDEFPARMRLEATSPRPEDVPAIALTKASAGYFETMRIPIQRGRGFSAADVSFRRPVAVISQAAARRYWPTSDPIGARITLDVNTGAPEWLEVVGLSGDVRNSDAGQPPPLHVYVPISRAPAGALSFAVRAHGADPLLLTSAIREAVAEVDDEEPTFAIRTMQQVIADDLRGVILITAVLIAVALISIVLATAGIYGVTSESVAHRTRELGVRAALGAKRGAMLRLVLAQTARPVVAGAAVGIIAALPLGEFAHGALPEIEFLDPLTYTAVVGGVLLVAGAAAVVPARRAARIDPATALRID